jgi:WD40 repeat protein
MLLQLTNERTRKTLNEKMAELSETLLELDDIRLWHVAFSSDGKYLACCGSNRVCLVFDWKNEKFVQTSTLEDSHSRTIRSCEFSPNTSRLLLCTCSFDATCVIWEKKTEFTWQAIATLDGHENEVKSISWSFDGLYLATCGRDKTCWVWEIDDGEDVDADDEDQGQRRLINNVDEEADRELKEEWRCVSVLTGHEGDVKMVKFHPARYLFASCSYDNSIRLWDFSEVESDFVNVAVLQGHENTVWGCDFVNDNLLVSCSQDLTIRTWARRQISEVEEDIIDGEERWDLLFTISALHTRTIFALDIFRATNVLATAGGDNAVVLHKLNPQNGFVDEVRAIKLNSAHEQDVNCVRFRPKDKTDPSANNVGTAMLATVGDDGKLKIWKVDLDRLAQTE